MKLTTNVFSISRELAENAVIAKVNGALWDLDRPLEGDSTVELLMFDNEEAQAVSVWKPELDLYDKKNYGKSHTWKSRVMTLSVFQHFKLQPGI